MRYEPYSVGLTIWFRSCRFQRIMLQTTDWQIAQKISTNCARVCLFAAATALMLPSSAFAQSDATTTADEPTLTWHGITLYGTYDIGVGWVSHGLPTNPYNYEGESLI